jgi:hypothetical protein
MTGWQCVHDSLRCSPGIRSTLAKLTEHGDLGSVRRPLFELSAARKASLGCVVASQTSAAGLKITARRCPACVPFRGVPPNPPASTRGNLELSCLRPIHMIERNIRQELSNKPQDMDSRARKGLAPATALRISDVSFPVNQIIVTAEHPGGEKTEGEPISRSDIKQLLQYNRLFGQQYNPGIAAGDKIGPRQKMDRTIAVRFNIPLEQLDKAKQLRLYIQDTHGNEFVTVKPLK